MLTWDLPDSPKKLEDAYRNALYAKIRSSSEGGQREANDSQKT